MERTNYLLNGAKTIINPCEKKIHRPFTSWQKVKPLIIKTWMPKSKPLTFLENGIEKYFYGLGVGKNFFKLYQTHTKGIDKYKYIKIKYFFITKTP